MRQRSWATVYRSSQPTTPPAEGRDWRASVLQGVTRACSSRTALSFLTELRREALDSRWHLLGTRTAVSCALALRRYHSCRAAAEDSLQAGTTLLVVPRM